MFIRTLCFCLCLNFLQAKAQDTTRIIRFKGKKFVIVAHSPQVTLYKKENSEKYYYSFPCNKKIKRLNYYRIIHKNASTYKLRENCRELRRRRIKLYAKHKDGEYYIFKVFNSYIQ